MEATDEKLRLEFELKVMPLTLNQLMGKHWRSRHSNFKIIHKLIHLLVSKSIPETPIQKARVSIWRHSSGTLDRDNAYFTAKPILDALVMSRVLEDDGLEQIKNLDIHQVKIKRTEAKKVVVLVEEL